MRILGLDYGEKTIGVAVSDALGTVAFGLETIRRSEEVAIKKSVARLKEIILEYEVSTLILGFPKNLDNSLSQRCEKTIEFQKRLQRNFKRLNIVLWDERLSTKGAGRILTDGGVKNKDVAVVIDKLAAIYILQGYLDYVNNEKQNTEANINE